MFAFNIMNSHTLFLHTWQFRYGILLFSGNLLNDRSRKLIGMLMRNFNVWFRAGFILLQTFGLTYFYFHGLLFSQISAWIFASADL